MTRFEGRAQLKLLRHSDLIQNDPTHSDPLHRESNDAFGSEVQGRSPSNDPTQLHGQMEVQRDPQAEAEAAEAKALYDARQSAMRVLANREHSRGELIGKLERKGIDREVARLAVDQLAEDGLQSDDRFVEAYVRSRVERGYGPIMIRQELRQREVGDELVDEYLTRDHAFWAARASMAVDKRFKAAPENRDAWGRQARYLSRRGFSSELIYASLGDQR